MPTATETRQSHNLELRKLTTLSAVGITMAGFVLLLIIAYAGWSSNASATQRERILLQNALNRSVARALNEQKSVAWWDDAVLKITDEAIDLDFVDSNFGIFLTETYGHDEVYILNGSDQPLYAFRDGARAEPSQYEARRATLAELVAEARSGKATTLKPRPDAFGADQKNYRTLGGAVAAARWAGHILSVDGRLAVVAALTIVPNQDMSLGRDPPNLLVSITNIDDDYIQGMGRLLLLDDLALTKTTVSRNGVVSEPFDGDDGVHAGYLSWTTQRPGQVLVAIILPLVALGVMAVAVLAAGMLRRLKRTSDDLASRESQASHSARHDAITGLPNRMHFGERLQSIMDSLNTGAGGRRAILAYIDIDRFKDVNDTLGHHAGDALIMAVAERLRLHMRPDDFLARYGGDEFAVVWVTPASRTADSLAERIAAAFVAPFAVEGQTIFVTASIGIASAPEHGATAEELMRHADIALYEAKGRGRNRAVFFTSDMAKGLEARRSVEIDLRSAIGTDELRLAYQPIVSSRTGAVTGIEALLRWRHPVRGDVSPAVFIPIAEQSGLMPGLGEWVLRTAMRDARQWPTLQVAINLSPVQLWQAEFEQTLARLVNEHGVDPGQFVLEITEGVMMEQCERTSRMFESIRRMGFKTALDDFGTGYSSLAYLCNFRFDKIKIDRSFVSGLSKSDSFRKIVHSLTTLGRGLGMEIVAEGVETEVEAVAMTEFGCCELQGYYFSRPIDRESLLQFLATYQPRPVPAAPSTDAGQSLAPGLRRAGT